MFHCMLWLLTSSRAPYDFSYCLVLASPPRRKGVSNFLFASIPPKHRIFLILYFFSPEEQSYPFFAFWTPVGVRVRVLLLQGGEIGAIVRIFALFFGGHLACHVLESNHDAARPGNNT